MFRKKQSQLDYYLVVSVWDQTLQLTQEILPLPPGLHLRAERPVPPLNEELCFPSPVQISFHPLANAWLVEHGLISATSCLSAVLLSMSQAQDFNKETSAFHP